MLTITDLKVDNADDIIIDHDLLAEDGVNISTMRTVERRTVSRDDDFIIDDISAGLEKFLFGTKSSYTNDDIMLSINNALQTDSLLTPYDYNLAVNETSDRRVHILIRFTNPMNGVDSFRIIVDAENQKIYRG